MLNITGMNRSYYIRNFTDMRCKYSRVLAVIRHQLSREPERDEVFIVMSRNRRLVRLFSSDRISFSLYAKRFTPEYQFMKIVRKDNELRSTNMMRALNYLDHFWDELFLYKTGGSYPINNNLAERSVRPFTTKRKCSLHFASD